MNGLILTIIICAICQLGCAEAPTQISQHYNIRYKTVGWKIDVLLNGVPVLSRDKGGGQLPISNLITNGTNSVEIKAQQLERIAEPLKMVVVAVSNTASRHELEVVDCSASPSRTETVTIHKKFEFNAQIPVRWLWESAENVKDLSTGDTNSIVLLVVGLGQSLKNKDIESHNRLRAAYIEDIVKSERLEKNQVESSMAQMLNGFFGAGSYSVQVRPASQLNIVTLGRITRVSAIEAWPEDWLIRLDADGKQFTYRDLLFSRVDGKWRIVN